jgi:hypothetical protein
MLAPRGFSPVTDLPDSHSSIRDEGAAPPAEVPEVQVTALRYAAVNSGLGFGLGMSFISLPPASLSELGTSSKLLASASPHFASL